MPHTSQACQVNQANQASQDRPDGAGAPRHLNLSEPVTSQPEVRLNSARHKKANGKDQQQDGTQDLNHHHTNLGVDDHIVHFLDLGLI